MTKGKGKKKNCCYTFNSLGRKTTWKWGTELLNEFKKKIKEIKNEKRGKAKGEEDSGPFIFSFADSTPWGIALFHHLSVFVSFAFFSKTYVKLNSLHRL